MSSSPDPSPDHMCKDPVCKHVPVPKPRDLGQGRGFSGRVAPVQPLCLPARCIPRGTPPLTASWRKRQSPHAQGTRGPLRGWKCGSNPKGKPTAHEDTCGLGRRLLDTHGGLQEGHVNPDPVSRVCPTLVAGDTGLRGTHVNVPNEMA